MQQRGLDVSEKRRNNLEELLAPMHRLGAAKSAIDERAHEILALHAALEREMDLALARALPHSDRLKGMGFGQKISILAACNKAADVDEMVKPLVQFNELRNAVAHGDSKAKVTAGIERLAATLPPLEPGLPGSDLDYAAAFLFGVLNSKKRLKDLSDVPTLKISVD